MAHGFYHATIFSLVATFATYSLNRYTTCLTLYPDGITVQYLALVLHRQGMTLSEYGLSRQELLDGFGKQPLSACRQDVGV